MRGAFPILSFVLPLLATPAAWGADVPITDEARAHFQSGVNLLKDPDGARYEDAYREFKAAYAAAASYKILGNLGLCALKLERDGEAIDAYEEYLKHAPDLDPAEVAQVKTDLSTLKSGVVRVTLTIDIPGALVTDSRINTRGEKVVNQYGPSELQGPLKMGVRAGRHQMIVRQTGYQDTTLDFDAPAGGAINKMVSLKKAEEAKPGGGGGPVTPTGPTRPIPTGVYIGVAATGALAIGATLVGIMAVGKKQDYDAANNGRSVPHAQDLHDQAVTLNLVNDILVGGAVVGAGVSALLFFTRPTVGGTTEKPASVQLVPVVASKSAGVVLSGNWF
jgi:hypothetical protein